MNSSGSSKKHHHVIPYLEPKARPIYWSPPPSSTFNPSSSFVTPLSQENETSSSNDRDLDSTEDSYQTSPANSYSSFGSFVESTLLVESSGSINSLSAQSLPPTPDTVSTYNTLTFSSNPVINAIQKILWFLKDQWFIFALVLVVFLAWLKPSIGSRSTSVSHGFLDPDIAIRIVVSIIFFLSGFFTPSFQTIKASIFNWRAHLLIQCYTFIFIPIFIYSFFKILEVVPFFSVLNEPPFFSDHFKNSLLILSSLPTSTSSCILHTSTTGGDVTLALFNSTLSNILSLILTPAWFLFFFSSRMHVFDAETFLQIHEIVPLFAFMLILPLFTGVLFRFIGNCFLSRKSVLTAYLSAGTYSFLSLPLLLVISYFVFCNTFVELSHDSDLSKTIAWRPIVFLSVFLIVLHLMSMSFLWSITSVKRVWKMDRSMRSAVVWVGSEKGLELGMGYVLMVFDGESVGVMGIGVLVYYCVESLLAGVVMSFMYYWVKHDPALMDKYIYKGDNPTPKYGSGDPSTIDGLIQDRKKQKKKREK